MAMRRPRPHGFLRPADGQSAYGGSAPGRNALREIEVAVASGDTAAALKVLARMVPEFDHNVTGSEAGLAVSAGARSTRPS